MNRREIRTTIFKLVFAYEFNKNQVNIDTINQLLDNNINVSLSEKKYILNKTDLLLKNINNIDDKIKKSASNWKINRITKTDLAILRVGVYEILYDNDIDLKIAINEAVNIAKEYGTDKSSSFVNGILGNIANG